MTLHWWMHWFWVTLWFTVITGVPLSLNNRGTTAPSTTGLTTEEDQITGDYVTTSSLFATQSEGDKEKRVVKESFYVKNDDFISTSSPVPSPSTSPSPSPHHLSLSSLRENYRVPKAIGINSTPSPATAAIATAGFDETRDDSIESRESPNNLTIVKNDYRVDRDAKIDKTSVLKLDEGSNYTGDDLNFNNNNRTSISGSNRSLSLIKKDSKVTWILTANKTSRNEKLITAQDDSRINSSLNNDDDDNLAVQPLDEPIPTRFKLVLNRTKFIPSTNLNNDKLLNKSDDVEIREDLDEPRLLATAASILQGISESPRLSRARSAFPSDYQQDEQQEQKQYKLSENGFANATSSAVDIAAVTGSCLATLVLIGTMGSLGFVMYRRRYLNPPQTLNSDKCSNPDSSGYIDDSTIRDNSEEMYSLDNDSFLNSLEAMTIQNYWTDSVKHTKL